MSENRQQFYQKNSFPPNNNETYKINKTNSEHHLKRSRLKKSYSECDNDEDDIVLVNSISSSPNKRKKKTSIQSIPSIISSTPSSSHHKTTNRSSKLQSIPSQDDYHKRSFSSLNLNNENQQPINESSTVTFSDKICQIPNNDNYNRNRTNFYTTDSVLSKSGSLNAQPVTQSSQSQKQETGSLKRGQLGRSTLSLCSCEADTEIVPDPMKPLYQYSLDRKKPSHTYTCEQNAKILMRIEKERQKKYNSANKLVSKC